MKNWLTLLALGTAGAALAAAGHRPASTPAAPSLCQAGESVLYSCPFARGTGSVCMGGGHLHYRFGRPGHVDIDIANAPDWGNIHASITTGGIRGANEEHLRFTRGQTHYTVYAGEAGQTSPDPGHYYSGIEVDQGADGNAHLASLVCHTPPPARSRWPLDGTEGLHPGPAKEPLNGPFDGW